MKDETPLQPPPRWLMILVTLVVISLILMILGGIGSIFVFQNVLRPGQQQRVINTFPFMEALLPSRVDINARVPTAQPNPNNAISPDDLLNLVVSTELPTSTLEPTLTTTSVPTAQATSAPSSTPMIVTAFPQSTSVPSFVLPPSARIYGLRGVVQTWNNCGPATITMGLSYFGWTEDQEFAASYLKPDEEDKNVTPSEMVRFVNEETGIRAVTRMGGTLDLIRLFIAGGFPVILSIGYAPEGEDWLGHYRAIVGFDDTQRFFYAYDSYLGTGENAEGISVSYDDLDSAWQQFNRRFIVLYEPQNEGRITEILGERADLNRAAVLALETAQSEIRADSRNGFAWFNMGTSLVALGRYEEAAIAYDQAWQLNLPWRMLWYQFSPYEAYFNVGRYTDVLAYVNANLNNGGSYVEETYFWQGKVFAMQGEFAQARTSFISALQANPNFSKAQEALDTLNVTPQN